MATHRIILSCTLALAVWFNAINAAVVTVLYVPAPISTDTPTPSQTVSAYSAFFTATTIASAIGPVDSGLTRYEVKEVHSNLVVYYPQTTETLISEPQTVTYTIDQGDGKILRQKSDPVMTQFPKVYFAHMGMNVECALDGDRKTGVCSGVHLWAHEYFSVFSGTQTIKATSTETIETTYTANVQPMATVLSTSDAFKAVSVPSILAFIATLGSVALGAFIQL